MNLRQVNGNLLYAIRTSSLVKLFMSFAHFLIAFLLLSFGFSSVQLFSCVWLFATPWTAARQASRLMFIELVMPSNHLILSSLLLPPSVFPSVRVFSNESALRIRRPEYWSFSFSVSPSSEHPGPLSLRRHWAFSLYSRH